MANRSKRSCWSDSCIEWGSWPWRCDKFRDHWHAMSYENTSSLLLEPAKDLNKMKSIFAYLQLISGVTIHTVWDWTRNDLTFPLSEDRPFHSFGQGHDAHIQCHPHRLQYNLERSTYSCGRLHGAQSCKDLAISKLAVTLLQTYRNADAPPSGIRVPWCTSDKARLGPNGPSHHPVEGHPQCHMPYSWDGSLCRSSNWANITILNDLKIVSHVALWHLNRCRPTSDYRTRWSSLVECCDLDGDRPDIPWHTVLAGFPWCRQDHVCDPIVWVVWDAATGRWW